MVDVMIPDGCCCNCGSYVYDFFHPLGQFGLIVDKSVCLFVCPLERAFF